MIEFLKRLFRKSATIGDDEIIAIIYAEFDRWANADLELDGNESMGQLQIKFTGQAAAMGACSNILAEIYKRKGDKIRQNRPENVF